MAATQLISRRSRHSAPGHKRSDDLAPITAICLAARTSRKLTLVQPRRPNHDHGAELRSAEQSVHPRIAEYADRGPPLSAFQRARYFPPTTVFYSRLTRWGSAGPLGAA
jgi:hypothetical protein